MTPDYITVTQAAETLAVSRVTIYKWIATKKLVAEEIAGRTVITRASVNAARKTKRTTR